MAVLVVVLNGTMAVDAREEEDEETEEDAEDDEDKDEDEDEEEEEDEDEEEEEDGGAGVEGAVTTASNVAALMSDAGAVRQKVS
jgi:ABC-type Zn2+ transport system substrate-binding protein/surface adhesin